MVHQFISSSTHYASRFTFHVSRYVYRVITGRHKGLLPTLVQGLLTPLSWIYGLVVVLRGWLYNWRIRKLKRLSCPVISVGNIVAGGTGKTPAVIWIAKYLQSEGFHVGVLLRGYRRKGRSETAIVSDGAKILTPATESGDEATMIAEALPGIPVVVGKDRYAAGLEAIRLWEGTEGVLILDDGFQHRQLARDLDIVTIDSMLPFGTGKLLPAGTLREPRTALKRADVVLLTRTDLAKKPVSLERFVRRAQLFESRHRPTRLHRLNTGEEFPLDLLKGKRTLAVCGIGNPEAFAETLRQFEPKDVELLAFPDHHRYSSADLRQIRDAASEVGANLVVTTEKDSQKLAAFAGKTELSPSESMQILVLAIELEITVGQEAFRKRLRQIVIEFQKKCNDKPNCSKSRDTWRKTDP